MAPLRVLYLMGHGWSGSTILGNALGQVDGVVHVGELRTLWGEALPSGARCGCGQPLAECPTWSAVLAHPLLARVDRGRAAAWARSATRVRSTPSLLRLRAGRPSGRPALDAHLDVAARLYRAVAEVTGAAVVVDSSKRSGDAAVLRLIPEVEAVFVHLVRDPRAVAYSWAKRGEPGHGPVRTARDWVAFNVLDEAIRWRVGPGRSSLVRYEDFVAQPEPTMRRILAMVGAADAALPLRGDGRLALAPTHTVLGNPVRFDTGLVELRERGEWRTGQRGSDRALVTVLSLPLLLRYAYPVRP